MGVTAFAGVDTMGEDFRGLTDLDEHLVSPSSSEIYAQSSSFKRTT